MTQLVKVGITHGDMNGVGYELLLKTFDDNRIEELCIPVIYGSSTAASYYRKILNLQSPVFHTINNIDDYKNGQVNLINCIHDSIRIEPGYASNDSGKAAYAALDAACSDLKNGKIDVLVTLPINKDTIQSENFKFPGHTEFLQDTFAEKESDKALMILATDKLRVALVTTHLPISAIPSMITKELIVEKLKALNYSLKRDFRIENPRIAVLGLNPHAGENGLLGSEEKEIIAPAVTEAQDTGILCAGPFAADGFFGSGRFKDFDAVLAMYHDQGLIPFKTLAMESGVNFTAGLPIVRTSPDHGTAYDIAGKGEASEQSFREAIYMAIDIYNNRTAFDEARSNPLRKMFFDRGRDDEKLDLTKEESEA
ncbi:MAG: 4-hydroxythreonine-4-phosphate dehydrogenase PdxA [Dysgonamonadaceae bacterium]|jgi:4-hydroxythreonine-4-phosphate dehydrogenase|nr:4-hydroxythreonine-4-phosphate dehydrogenase PdxA [Dysgonamonadaceae bacterium]